MVAPMTHATQQNITDWLILQNQVFSLVVMLTLISQPLYNLSQQEFYHAYPLHIYTCLTSHILWENLQTYNIDDTVQQEKEHNNQGECQAVGNRKISMIFPLVSCCSCVNKPSSS